MCIDHHNASCGEITHRVNSSVQILSSPDVPHPAALSNAHLVHFRASYVLRPQS
ncbi:hypothetical protein Z947_1936 [Sulfitobacter geojensis]|nr:hypothetical protein Z947_1936 [Sulfitobacter geojensis]